MRNLWSNHLKKINGFDFDFNLASNPKIALQRYDRYLYDALVLLCSSVEQFWESIDVAAIINFVDSGYNFVIAADVNASDLIQEVAIECGVDFEEDPLALVIDHTGYSVSEIEGDHALIAFDDFIKSDVILGSKKITAPVLFQCIGNSLVLKVLSVSPSAYSANSKSKLSTPPLLTDSAIPLVLVVQKAGSTTKKEKSGNEQILTEVSKWVLYEKGHPKANVECPVKNWKTEVWPIHLAARIGLEMMFRTCTVQVNLDFSSEADMIRKFRAGLAIAAGSYFALIKAKRVFGHVWSNHRKKEEYLIFILEDKDYYEEGVL